MDPLEQRVERERIPFGNNEFAVEDEPRRVDRQERLDDFRKVPRQWLAALGAELDLVAVAKGEAAEAVPLRFVLPLAAGRQVGDEPRVHRFERSADRKGHGGAPVAPSMAELIMTRRPRGTPCSREIRRYAARKSEIPRHETA